MKPNLAVNIGRLKLANPVMVASGTFGYAEEFKDYLDTGKLGAIITKTITLRPRKGNLPPRTCETPAGMLNSIGLENPGLDSFIQDKLPGLKRTRVPIIVSIASENDPREFITLVRRLDESAAVAAIELNISCPNVSHARIGDSRASLISQDPQATFKVIKSVRKITKKTIITKLSPNVTCISDIALAAQEAGTDAVSLINTLYGMSIDIVSRKPRIAAAVGGLSGPAIRPIAVKMVWETYRKVKVPIIGMGGIVDTQSALEFFIAGATAISVGTANFVNPMVSVEIIEGIQKYLSRNKIKKIEDFSGCLDISI